jgi:protein-tyrosine phosphatase
MATAFERSIRLDGATNFRDLGGYRGIDGRPVRWRTLFRSDHLGELSAQDVGALRALQLGRVFDFRGVQERAALPDKAPGMQSWSLPVEPTVFARIQQLLQEGEPITQPLMVATMEETYRDFVRNDTAQFSGLFAHLLDDATPLVFHCTAGKDRTGFAAAMILLALGISRDAVMEDYLLTNRCYRAPAAPPDARVPTAAREVLWGVRAEFLAAALDVIDTDCGGVDAYLDSQLGMGPAERARLAQAYLSD